RRSLRVCDAPTRSRRSTRWRRGSPWPARCSSAFGRSYRGFRCRRHSEKSSWRFACSNKSLAATSAAQHELPREKGLGVSLRRRAFDAAKPHQPVERLRRIPTFPALARERRHEMLNLAPADRGSERHEQVGLTEVSVVFRDLVLENEMVAERLARQRGHQ